MTVLIILSVIIPVVSLLTTGISFVRYVRITHPAVRWLQLGELLSALFLLIYLLVSLQSTPPLARVLWTCIALIVIYTGMWRTLDRRRM